MSRDNEVLLIDQATTLGGGQTALLNLVDAYAAAGYTPTVLAPLGGAIEPMLRERLGSSDRLIPLRSNSIAAKGRLRWIADRVAQSCVVTALHARDLARYSLVHVNGPRLFLPV
ncbi:MAG: hypothetical protein LCH95_19835, partial [Proteobacteria bacterium]|nr:hypothetical protein [Pseudomonadota bacterium]